MHDHLPSVETDQGTSLPPAHAPIVVIQYRTSVVPILLLAGCLVLLAIGGYAYHRSVVDRLKQRSDELLRMARTSNEVRDPESREQAPGRDPSHDRPVAEGRPVSSDPAFMSPLALNVQPESAEPRPHRAPPAEIQVQPKTGDTPTARPQPEKAAEIPSQTGKVSPKPVAAAVAADPVPPEPSRVAITTEEPEQPSPLPEPKPLPTKEETLQAIQAEVTRKQQETAERSRSQAAELRTIREESRSKFREELRSILNEQGNKAGGSIDKLSDRYREYVPDRLYQQASKIWGYSSLSIDDRILRIRALGLSEVLVLDLISDNLNAHLRARNGPPNKNELRIRAAKMFLLHDPATLGQPAGRNDRDGDGNGLGANVSPRAGQPAAFAIGSR